MQEYDPKLRALNLITEQGERLVATRLESCDQVDGLYEHRISFIARKLDPQKLLGTPVGVACRSGHNGAEHFFHGICTEIRKTGVLESKGYDQFSAVLVPWFWMLRHRTNCRIFQNQKTSEIINTLVKEHGFSSQIALRAKGDTTREYCVQFNETDLDFICRLLKEEGWHWHFQQEKSQHILVIGSDNRCFKALVEPDIEYFSGSNRLDKAITDWQHSYRVGPGSVQTSDYSYELAEAMPGKKINSARQVKAQKTLQHYFYPGRFKVKDAGATVATHAIEGFDSRYSQVEGGGSLGSFYAGGRFKLVNHPESSERGEYLLLEVFHEVSTDETGMGFNYSNRFHCIPANVDYRPLVSFEKPKILGLQSAKVTGPSSEEVHMGEYSRVKVQFHWDLNGKDDGSSSCWVRVAQHLAGNQFGSQFIPRVGDEVLVSFIDSDPDKPVIVGSVYNETHKPPYKADTSQGFKLQSSPKGGADTFNELRFDNKKNEEKVFLQAEKDLVVHVKNDRQETINGSLTEDIKKAAKRLVQEDDQLTVKGQQKLSVTKDISISTEADYHLTTTGNYKLRTDGNVSQTIKGKTSVDSTGDVTLDSSASIHSKAASQITNEAVSIKDTGTKSIDLEVGASSVSLSAKGIKLSCGSSVIKLSQSGIEISGIKVSAEGKVKAELKSAVNTSVEGTVKTDIKGTMVTIQGSAMTQVKAGAMLELQGAIAKIN